MFKYADAVKGVDLEDGSVTMYFYAALLAWHGLSSDRLCSSLSFDFDAENVGEHIYDYDIG